MAEASGYGTFCLPLLNELHFKHISKTRLVRFIITVKKVGNKK